MNWSITAGLFDNVMPRVRYISLTIRLSFNAIVVFNISKLFTYNLHYRGPTSLSIMTL